MTIVATARNGADADGIDADNGGKVDVHGKGLSITAAADTGNAYGIYAGGIGHNALVEINSWGTTTIEATSENTEFGSATAIKAAYGGKVKFDTTINTGSEPRNLNINPNAADPYKIVAIHALEGGKVDIGSLQEGSTPRTVTIKGNILTDEDKKTKVSVLLDGKASFWTGNALSDGTGSGLVLQVDNGAHWTADGSKRPTEGEYAGAETNVLRSLYVDKGWVTVGGTLTVLENLNEKNDSHVQADKVQIGRNVTAAISDSQLNTNTLTLGENAKLTVQGSKSIVNVTGSLTGGSGASVSSEPGTSLTLSNLAGTLPQMDLRGITYYNLGDNDWENPKKLNAAHLTVDPSYMEVLNPEGLRPGTTVKKLVLENTYDGQGQPAGQTAGSSGTLSTQLTHNGKRNLLIGTTLQGTAEAALVDNDVYYQIAISKDPQPQTHRAVMAQGASLTTVSGGFDFLTQAMDGMTGSGVYGIASVGGGEHKYDTGSHIKTNAWHAIAGVGVKNGGTEYGAFYDYGDGHYRTYSDGRGDGKTTYKGAGLFGKYTFTNDFYVEGSFRAGRVKNNASGIFHDDLGNRYGLKLSAGYNAFHVGVCKVLSVGGNDTLDVYGKFFHTHIGSDSFEAEGHYDIDSVDSNILRIGTRWNHKAGAWNNYLGVAYEYEFDGEAKGTADGARIESADIGGSSVRFEIGTSVETGKWVIGFNADAYAGQHKGFDGSITAGLRF